MYITEVSTCGLLCYFYQYFIMKKLNQVTKLELHSALLDSRHLHSTTTILLVLSHLSVNAPINLYLCCRYVACICTGKGMMHPVKPFYLWVRLDDGVKKYRLSFLFFICLYHLVIIK